MPRDEKYIHRSTARGCPVHTAVLQTALTHLKRQGFFSKDKVLTESNMQCVGSAIRWDYLRGFIQEDHKIELIPLVNSFFSKDCTIQKQLDNPERYIAGGDGGKTAGYASVTEKNKHFVITHIAIKDKWRNGVDDAFDAYCALVKQRVPSLTADEVPALASTDAKVLAPPGQTTYEAGSDEDKAALKAALDMS